MIIDNLIASSNSAEDLERFIFESREGIFDFFMWSTDIELFNQRIKIENYLASRRSVIENLDSSELNLSFVSMLLDCSERLGLISAFQYLYTFLVNCSFDIGSRLHAAALYLLGIRNGDALVLQFDKIYALLQKSYLEEEDNSDKVLITIVNYYRKAIQDFGEFNMQVASAIRNKIREALILDEYSFLNHPVITDILDVELTFGSADLVVSGKLDEYLHRGKAKGKVIDGILLEQSTPYSLALSLAPNNLSAIRSISVEKYNSEANAGVYNSLHRGTRILDAEIQLAGYMYSFGKMHFEKLQQAFEKLPEDFSSKRINLIDWGCGQAMGTMVYLNYCQILNLPRNIEQIILIEPSELALSRGALHVTKFLPGANYSTICKVFDDIEPADISVVGGINLHLFSNVLDMDCFSLEKLTTLMKGACRGKNYCVIVGPYVNGTKKARIDAFVNSFSHLQEFTSISVIDQKSGEWTDGWTRHERVFSVRLSG